MLGIVWLNSAERMITFKQINCYVNNPYGNRPCAESNFKEAS